jgi:CDP-paratose 2-epimerase
MTIMPRHHVLITGGAGFIGCNVAARWLRDGHRVTVLDNFSRAGARLNAEWLQSLGGDHLRVLEADARDFDVVREAVAGVDVVFHFASQVAVTTSIANPRLDFESNLLSTFNVLEALRLGAPDAALIFTSTNKVYGALDDVPVVDTGERYEYGAGPGVDESRPLDFHSPYGCSKGAADQYVRDYARVFNLRTVVFRMSCIYGEHQLGSEDQGWVAHFIYCALLGQPVTIFGDGKQVRDILFADDLVEAFLAAYRRIDAVRGDVFNIGGGIRQTLSLRELIRWIQARAPLQVDWARSRVGDQKIYVSDIAKAAEGLGWTPSINVEAGLERLWAWGASHRDLLERHVRRTQARA